MSTGLRGQYDVIVDGNVVARRTGGLFTRLILRSGWPDIRETIEAVNTALRNKNS